MVVNAGKYEFIGIRHRESQSLYITDVFKPNKPGGGVGYGEIHVGIYISALLETIEREKEKTRPSQPPGPRDGAEASNSSSKDADPADSGDHNVRVDEDGSNGTPGDRSGGSSTQQGGKTRSNCTLALEEVSLSYYLRRDGVISISRHRLVIFSSSLFATIYTIPRCQLHSSAWDLSSQNLSKFP